MSDDFKYVLKDASGKITFKFDEPPPGMAGLIKTPVADPDLIAFLTHERPEDVAATKNSLANQVDVMAERLRLTLITPGSGQAMEYQESYAQAKVALAASGTPDPADYPMLAATVGLDTDPSTGKPATDILGVARSVKRAYEGYLQAGAAIKEARVAGKRAISTAPTTAAALAAHAAIVWPTLD